ncbi:MAG: hypothetical protein ACYTJ0_18740, partial [Planctomycetota bacterium]
AIFAYFGFMLLFPADPLAIGLMWALRVTAVGFLVAALLSMGAPRPGELLYAAIGLASAAAFVIIAVWDLATPRVSGVAPVLLLIFAAWNGYGSWGGLRASVPRSDA